jgi:hypothetical protein
MPSFPVLPDRDQNALDVEIAFNGARIYGTVSADYELYTRETADNYRLGSALPYSTSLGSITFNDVTVQIARRDWVTLQQLMQSQALGYEEGITISIKIKASGLNPGQTDVLKRCVFKGAKQSIAAGAENLKMDLTFKPSAVISNGIPFAPRGI